MGKDKALLILLVLAALVGFSLTALGEGVMNGKQISDMNDTMQKNASDVKFESYYISNLTDDYPLAVEWYRKNGISILDYDQFMTKLPGNLENPGISVITELKGPAPKTDSWSYVEVARVFDENHAVIYTMTNLPLGFYAMSHFAQESDGVIVPFDYAYNRWTSKSVEEAYQYYYWMIRPNLMRWEGLLKSGAIMPANR